MDSTRHVLKNTKNVELEQRIKIRKYEVDIISKSDVRLTEMEKISYPLYKVFKDIAA